MDRMRMDVPGPANDQINGDRINGLFHLLMNVFFVGLGL